MVPETRVTSWAELNDRLFAGSWNDRLGRFRADRVYRGMPDSAFDLSTSLMRLGGSFPDLEGHLLRTFRRYAARYAAFEDSPWNWLALAQHHGLPTRLLDWTYSPYVALHFATAAPARLGSDAVVWSVDFVATNRRLPETLRDALTDEGASVFTAEMLQRAAPTILAFDTLAPEPFVAFFEPPSIDDRIVNQFALFSLMSNSDARLDGWLAAHPASGERIIIPGDMTWEVRDKLDQINITERVLLPGLDGLCAWLARYYDPRSIRQ